MNPRSLIARGQAAAESLMLDACTVQRVTGTTEDANGVVTPTYSTVYTGKFKLQASSEQFPSTPQAGQRVWTLITAYAHFPLTATADVDDVLTVTASVDPANVGRQFRVTANGRKTFATAFRLSVQEIAR